MLQQKCGTAAAVWVCRCEGRREGGGPCLPGFAPNVSLSNAERGKKRPGTSVFSREKKVESRPNGMDASAVGPLKRANCAPALLCAALAHVPPRRASPALKGFRIKAPIAPAEEDRPLLESPGPAHCAQAGNRWRWRRTSPDPGGCIRRVFGQSRRFSANSSTVA